MKSLRFCRRLLCVGLSLILPVLTLGSCAATDPPYPAVENHVTQSEDTLTITSPDHGNAFVLSVEDGRLSYRVERDGIVHMSTSPLGLTVGEIAYGEVTSLADIGDITGSLRNDKRAINGRVAVAEGMCIEMILPVNAANAFTLEVRVFDDGVAFRYRLPDEGARVLSSEQTGFILPADSGVWGGVDHVYYETIQKYADPAKPAASALGTPVTVALPDGGYTAVLEGDLENYPGLKLQWQTKNTYTAAIGNTAPTLEGEITTPWRIVSVASDLNELVNNTIVYQVCDQADEALFGDDWVQPGRATWSWITGRTTDRVTEKLMETYTRYAAQLGFEYNIIDEGWINWNMYALTLKELAEEGNEYGVGQILWTGVTAGASFGGGIDSAEDAYAYLDLIDQLGMAGGKIDFFTTESHVEQGVDLYRDILAYAAEKELVINFHGCNKPTGYDATYPNELNREAILGLEATAIENKQFQAQLFTTQPFTRNLAGHADFTPAVDEAFHMAQLVLTDAPMQAFGSNPAHILASPALEMIKSVPTVWEETIVLPQSAIGKSAVIARRGANGSWYIGGINSSLDTEEITLDLSAVLGEGTYRCELWTDGTKGLEMTEQTVTASDTLTVPFSKTSGFIVRFDRVTLSQYGGEIDPDTPVTIHLADEAVTVRYTTDGTTPDKSSATLSDGDALSFDATTVLTLQIVDGDNTTVVRYRFNKLD